MVRSEAIQAELVEDLAPSIGRREEIAAIGFAEEGRPTLLVTDGRRCSAVQPDRTRVELRGPAIQYPAVQALPGGDVVVIGRRCRSDEHNAVVFAPDGHRRSSFRAADGIESVQTTRSGDLWVSYFDEGVFGNMGWRGEEDPPSATGLVRFTADGTIAQRFTPPPGVGQIADCYALNVAEEAVWTYYYTDFALVRVEVSSSQAWSTPVVGANAFALHGDQVLFYGGYGDNWLRAILGRLDDGKVERVVTGPIVHRHRQLTPDVVVGRGRSLHLLEDTRWYRVDLAEVHW